MADTSTSPIVCRRRSLTELTKAAVFLSALGKQQTNDTYSRDDVIFNIGAELFAEDHSKIVFTILNSVCVNYFFNMHSTIEPNVLDFWSQV